MQAVAPLDCLAHLPGLPAKGSRAAASIYAGQLLAYAAASAVVVVDVSCPVLRGLSTRCHTCNCVCLHQVACLTCQAASNSNQCGRNWESHRGVLFCKSRLQGPRSTNFSLFLCHLPPEMQAQRMCVATTLAGAHRQAAVSALAWWVLQAAACH